MAGFWQRLMGNKTAADGPPAPPLAGLVTDMHSHLLPGLDDGAETVAHSLDLLRELRALGFTKLVMTPHIMGDFYKNTPEGVRAALATLRAAAAEAGLTDVTLECAAEYYLDEWLGRKLADGTELLTFGEREIYVSLIMARLGIACATVPSSLGVRRSWREMRATSLSRVSFCSRSARSLSMPVILAVIVPSSLFAS